MTTDHLSGPDIDMDRRLTAWLESDAAPRAPEDLVEAFTDMLGETRQRPGWATTGRWISMETTARIGGTPRPMMIALALMALIGLAVASVAIGSTLLRPPAGPTNGLLTYTLDGAIVVADGPSGRVTRLTDDSEYSGAPYWSPDGSRFSYESSSAEDGPRAIIVRNADGSNPVRLTPYLDAEPGFHVWSRDGSGLLFDAGIGPGEAGSRIYRVATDGSGADSAPEVLGPPDLEAQRPVELPGGDIVFAGAVSDGTDRLGLYRMSADGTGVRRLGDLSGAALTFWRIDLSPDGSRVVTQAAVADHNHDIYLVDVETGAYERVTDDSVDAYDASWSPDGTRILYSWSPGYVFDPHPAVLDVATMEIRPINVRFWAREWSPDGTEAIGFGPAEEIAVLDLTKDDITAADVVALDGSQGGGDVDWQPANP